MSKIRGDGNSAGIQTSEERCNKINAGLMQQQDLVPCRNACCLQSSCNGPGLPVKPGVGNAAEVVVFRSALFQKAICGLLRLGLRPVSQQLDQPSPLLP